LATDTTFPPTFGSPLAAYRGDATAHDGPFGPHDGLWISVATLVDHAASADLEQKSALLQKAIKLTRDAIDGETLTAAAEREWGNRDRCSCEPIMLLAKVIADAGALRLAAALLDALPRADQSLNDVQRGRVLAQRARVAWLTGEIEDARARYAFVESLGRRCRSPELKVRAWIGFGALAQMRGNLPAMRTFARRAARVADRERMGALSRTAHHGVLVAAAADQHYDEALIEGWKVYQLSVDNPIDEAAALQTIGQVLLSSGRMDVAAIAFSAVCSRPLPARILFPALGGLAIASASVGNEATMEWAVAEIRGMRRTAAARYAVASAILECARALEIIGRQAEAVASARESLALAKRYGFHEIELRAEAMLQAKAKPEPSNAPTTLTRRTASVVREISSLEPPRLPDHVRPTAVEV
jgi:tetratricopeptide (TPR) repeat protein